MADDPGGHGRQERINAWGPWAGSRPRLNGRRQPWGQAPGRVWVPQAFARTGEGDSCLSHGVHGPLEGAQILRMPWRRSPRRWLENRFQPGLKGDLPHRPAFQGSRALAKQPIPQLDLTRIGLLACGLAARCWQVRRFQLRSAPVGPARRPHLRLFVPEERPTSRGRRSRSLTPRAWAPDGLGASQPLRAWRPKRDGLGVVGWALGYGGEPGPAAQG